MPKRILKLALLGPLTLLAGAALADCELVEIAEAQLLLGADVSDVSGDDAAAHRCSS